MPDDELTAINRRIAELEAELAARPGFEISPEVRALVRAQYGPIAERALADLARGGTRGLEDLRRQEGRVEEALGVRGVRGLEDLLRFTERGLEDIGRGGIEAAGLRGLRVTDTPVAAEVARLRSLLGQDVGTRAERLAQDILREGRISTQDIATARQRLEEDVGGGRERLLAQLGGQEAGALLGLAERGAAERRARLSEALRAALGRGELTLRQRLSEQQLDIARQELALRGELGRAEQARALQELALRGELGRGELGLRGEELGLRRELGRGELGLRGRQVGVEESAFEEGIRRFQERLRQQAFENRLRVAGQIGALAGQLRGGGAITQTTRSPLDLLGAQSGIGRGLEALGDPLEKIFRNRPDTTPLLGGSDLFIDVGRF